MLQDKFVALRSAQSKSGHDLIAIGRPDNNSTDRLRQAVGFSPGFSESIPIIMACQ
jgi:hypothetical protein